MSSQVIKLKPALSYLEKIKISAKKGNCKRNSCSILITKAVEIFSKMFNYCLLFFFGTFIC